MAGHKKNGSADNGGVKTRDGVWVSREEFDALMCLKEANADRAAKDAQASVRTHDLAVTCNAQARRLIEVDMAMQHLERINGLQRVLIDMFRADHPRVGSLEDLSEFWRRWCICTENLVKEQPQQRGTVAELTPDLFRLWSMWVRDAGRLSRSFAVAGTRAEADKAAAASQGELQDVAVVKLREVNVALAARVRELEGEVDAYRTAMSKAGT